jgi:hypothetical protein
LSRPFDRSRRKRLTRTARHDRSSYRSWGRSVLSRWSPSSPASIEEYTALVRRVLTECSASRRTPPAPLFDDATQQIDLCGCTIRPTANAILASIAYLTNFTVPVATGVVRQRSFSLNLVCRARSRFPRTRRMRAF